MVTKQRAVAAVRAMAQGVEKGELLSFLRQVLDRELGEWGIEDEDDDETVFGFIRREAQREAQREARDAAAGLGSQSAAAAGAAAGTAAAAPRGMPPADTTNEYLREMLRPPAMSLSSQPGQPDLRVFLAGPLGRKLPAGWPYVTQAVLTCGSDIQAYVIEDNAVAVCVRDLSTAVLLALYGPMGGPTVTSEYGTAFQVQAVVDTPLNLAARALNLNIRVNRGVRDTSGATTRRLRPDFLCWVENVLLFKGEEKALAADLEVAIEELPSKMANTWNPELLPGISMPCMLAYAAAGNLLQFFAIIKSGGRPAALPISCRHDLGTGLGRIRAFHGTCNIVRLLASYAPKAPRLSVALGSVIQAKSSSGELLRTITFFEDFVRKRISSFEEQHTGINDFSTLQDLYTNATLMECANLVHLHAPGDIRLDGKTLVLHLAPVGVPQHGPPADEASLKRAIRDTITGVAALHGAGFVHRDIRWPNVVRLPGGSQPGGMADTFVLIDLEHAARGDCTVDCRQPPYPLASWPQGIPDLADGRYTPASDLCLVSHCLMSGLPFTLSPSGQALKHALATRQLSAEGALAHEWLAAEGAM